MIALILIGMATILGPRLIDVVFWIFAQDRWSAAFDNVLWPILGIILLPWTTLAYVLVAPGGLTRLDIIVVLIGVFADIGTYGGNAYKGQSVYRDR